MISAATASRHSEITTAGTAPSSMPSGGVMSMPPPKPVMPRITPAAATMAAASRSRVICPVTSLACDRWGVGAGSKPDRDSFFRLLDRMLPAELLAKLVGGLHHEGQLLKRLADGKPCRGSRDGEGRAQRSIAVPHRHCETHDAGEKLLIVHGIAALLDLAGLAIQRLGIADRILGVAVQGRHLHQFAALGLGHLAEEQLAHRRAMQGHART